MYPVNPNMLIQLIKQGQNPQQLMLKVLSGQAAGNPLANNLLSLAKQGRTTDIEQVVRNLYAQQGGQDFDRDFAAFKRSLGYETQQH